MADKQWFETWFDSPYYHLLYANRSAEEAEKFISAISEHLRIPDNAKVLDVACGKGRHSKTLARLGFDVTGIDLSKNSIEDAKQYSSDKLHFDVWDMRKTYKEEEFDFVFNLFSSFGYFDNEDDDYAAIQAMYNNLKQGGVLVLDYINTEYAVKHMKDREIIPRGDTQFHIKKRIEQGFIKKKIEFLVNGEDHTYEEQLKVINQFRFDEMLSAADFKLLEVFGDYELNPFNAAVSPRLILVARKP